MSKSRNNPNAKKVENTPDIVQPAAAVDFGQFTVLGNDVRSHLFFGFLGRSNAAIKALRGVNRSFHHFVNGRNQSEIDKVKLERHLERYFLANPGCNRLTFNLLARYIPASIVNDMFTNQQNDSFSMVNECNLKAFMTGTLCKDKDCKHCDKSDEVYTADRTVKHNCGMSCALCGGAYDYRISKSKYTNEDCLILGAHQDAVVALPVLDAEKAMRFARMTQNIPFIFYMCERLNLGRSEQLKLVLGSVLESGNNAAAVAVSEHLPESKVDIAIGMLKVALKRKCTPEQMIRAIEHAIFISSGPSAKTTKAVTTQLLTEAHRIEMMSTYHNETLVQVYNGSVLHLVAFLQETDTFAAVLAFYQKNSVDVSACTLEYTYSNQPVRTYSLMDCAVQAKRLGTVQLVQNNLPHLLLTAGNVNTLLFINTIDQSPVRECIFSFLSGNLSLDTKRQIFRAYLDGLKQFDKEIGASRYPQRLSHVIACYDGWGDLAEEVNPVQLLAPYDAAKCMSVLCGALTAGWNPGSVKGRALLQSLTEAHPQLLEINGTSSAMIFADLPLLQLMCRSAEISAVDREEIQRVYLENQASHQPRLLPYLVMAWLVFKYPQNFGKTDVSEIIKEAKNHFTLEQLTEGMTAFKVALQDKQVSAFENVVLKAAQNSKCCVM